MDSRPRYRVPDELRETLLDFTIAYLLERPANLPAFGLQFFSKLYESKKKLGPGQQEPGAPGAGGPPAPPNDGRPGGGGGPGHMPAGGQSSAPAGGGGTGTMAPNTTVGVAHGVVNSSLATATEHLTQAQR